MNLKIIGVLSTLALLNAACSKEENRPPSYTNTGAISSLTASSAAVIESTLAEPADSSGNTDPAARELVNTHWKLIVLDNSDVPATEKEREPYLVFDTEKHISGSDGCNRLTGSYSQESDKLALGDLASTKMACTEGGEQADAFQSALAKVTHYTIHADQLELRDDTGLVLARLQAVAQP